jgi:Uma2 family endonuclease
MSLVKPVEHFTLDDYRRWKGDWELIDGVALAMAPSPVLEHQRLSGSIYRRLAEALDECSRCEVLFEIDVAFSEDTVVRPDVLVICYEPEGERLTRAPELIFEVVSKTTARRDEETKFRLYRDEGVANYVLVYPQAKKAKAYRLVDGDYRKAGDFYDESHRFVLSNCAFKLDFSGIWPKKGV